MNRTSINWLATITSLVTAISSQPLWAQTKSRSSKATSAPASSQPSANVLPAASAPYTQNDPLAMYKRTGINQAQIDKINALTAEFQKLLTEKTQVMVGLMRDMRAISLQVTPDDKVTLAKQAEINALNNEMANQRIKLMLAMRNVLTVEQRQKLVQFMNEGAATPPTSSSAPADTNSAGSK